ncbi:hypothetical protein [Amycolatopsis sp. WGS_07]|uniref:hypothetical protein n=1 Tax=Amycolatopsis sp. WGS_07 TaxID=3076764 RepID=UPI003872C693
MRNGRVEEERRAVGERGRRAGGVAGRADSTSTHGTAVNGGGVREDRAVAGRAVSPREDREAVGGAVGDRVAGATFQASADDRAAEMRTAPVIHDSPGAHLAGAGAQADRDSTTADASADHDRAENRGAWRGDTADAAACHDRAEERSAWGGDATVIHDSAAGNGAPGSVSPVMHDSAAADSAVGHGAADVIHETPSIRDSSTVGDEEAAERDGAAKRKPRGRWWRGFTGSVAAGMAVLAVGVLVVGVLCFVNGASGPGVLKLVGHPVAAVIVLVLQRVADRRVGKVAGVAGVGVLVVAAVALGVLWWF